MKTKIALFAVLLTFHAAAALSAAAPAVVAWAEGNGFVLVSDGKRTVWDISSDNVIGIALKEGDTILTDDDSYLEIQLNTGNGGIVKIAENTTFTMMTLEDDGGGVFRVVYGRIRVKVASMLGSSRIWITGHDTVAGVRGTDFGYDLFYDANDDTSVRNSAVYVFDGEVDVVKYDEATTSKADLLNIEPYLLSTGEMVTVSSDRPDEKLKARDIDQDILDYWAALPVMTGISEAQLVQVNETPVVSESLNLSDEAARRHRDMEVGGKFVFATGIGLMTTAALLRVFADVDPEVPVGLMAVGAGATIGGTGMLIYSVKLR